nr:adenylate/guanylate cyclase domain-containing protein [Longispora albida]
MAAHMHLPSGQVTFLFTDIEGSTRLAQLLGDGYRPVLNDHRRLMRLTFGDCDGAELLTEGDSFFVAFADATAALIACVTAQRALADHSWPSPAARPRVRMGLHTGYAVPHAGEYATFEVHRAARVAAAAHGGQVLCSGATARRVTDLPDGLSLVDLGLHRLRGFDDRERLYQLAAPGLEYRFPPPRTMDATPHNLPAAPTSFIGRLDEQVKLRQLVCEQRLVTVVGAGGAGKTRLAVAVATDLVDSYQDGVWFTDLASVTDPALIAVGVASAFGLRPEPGRPMPETLVEHAAQRQCLLVLDTCDHQLTSLAPLVTRLLASCPGLTILATSREPIGLPGEAVWRIPSLSVTPQPDGGPSDAVALLLDRAAAARGGRRAEPAELPHLDRVARRLDGLPLALELAAARLRLLAAGQLAERLEDLLLAGPGESANRHETLSATVSWSYRTLGPRAAKLLRHLSVFAGPVELEAIEWLLGDDPLDPLAVLVDKSLVQAEPTAVGTTYRMLDPIRAYGQRKLLQSGEEEAARDRHVAWCRHAAERAGRDAEGRAVTLSMHALDPLSVELRTALRWSTTGGDVREGLRLAGALDQWWRERGLAREGRVWLYRLYERMTTTDTPVPSRELALAYNMHAAHAGVDGEYAEALRFSQRAEAAARQAGDPGLLVRVLAGRASPLVDIGLVAEAERSCWETLRLAAELDVEADALFAIFYLAQLLWRRGELDEAANLLASARPLEAARPAERGRRTVDMLLGLVALERGDLVAAHEHLQVALRSRMAYGFGARAVETLNAIGVRCHLGGQPDTAAVLFGAAESERGRLRCSAGAYAPYWAEQHSRTRSRLGDLRFDTLYAEGAAMPLTEAVAAALAVEHPDLTSGGMFAAGGQVGVKDES